MNSGSYRWRKSDDFIRAQRIHGSFPDRALLGAVQRGRPLVSPAGGRISQSAAALRKSVVDQPTSGRSAASDTVHEGFRRGSVPERSRPSDRISIDFKPLAQATFADLIGPLLTRAASRRLLSALHHNCGRTDALRPRARRCADHRGLRSRFSDHVAKRRGFCSRGSGEWQSTRPPLATACCQPRGAGCVYGNTVRLLRAHRAGTRHPARPDRHRDGDPMLRSGLQLNLHFHTLALARPRVIGPTT